MKIKKTYSCYIIYGLETAGLKIKFLSAACLWNLDSFVFLSGSETTDINNNSTRTPYEKMGGFIDFSTEN